MVVLTPESRVLATAAKEIGYSRWTDKQQGTKYARETQPVFWPRDKWLLANGISFCDIFVTWVFWKALGKAFVTGGGLPAGASYNTDYRAAHGGRVSKASARPGDILVFDWNWSTIATNHVGILEKRLASGNFQAIEGNTSPGTAGSQSNGGGVYRRVRRPDQVRYVIRPNWGKAGTSITAKPASKPAPAKAAPVGVLEVDGKIGPATAKRLQEFLVSRGHKLTVDGKLGHASWKALQAYLHTPVDGIVSKQSHPAKEISPLGAITQGWDYTGPRSAGSTMVRALQKWVHETQDGVMGHGTVKALQRKLNEHLKVDG